MKGDMISPAFNDSRFYLIKLGLYSGCSIAGSYIHAFGYRFYFHLSAIIIGPAHYNVANHAFIPAQNKNLSFQEKQRNLAKFDDLIGTLQRRKCNPYPWSGNLYFPSKFLYYRVWGLTLKINLLVIIIWKSKLKTIHVHTRNIS